MSGDEEMRQYMQEFDLGQGGLAGFIAEQSADVDPSQLPFFKSLLGADRKQHKGGVFGAVDDPNSEDQLLAVGVNGIGGSEMLLLGQPTSDGQIMIRRFEIFTTGNIDVFDTRANPPLVLKEFPGVLVPLVKNGPNSGRVNSIGVTNFIADNGMQVELVALVDSRDEMIGPDSLKLSHRTELQPSIDHASATGSFRASTLHPDRDKFYGRREPQSLNDWQPENRKLRPPSSPEPDRFPRTEVPSAEVESPQNRPEKFVRSKPTIKDHDIFFNPEQLAEGRAFVCDAINEFLAYLYSQLDPAEYELISQEFQQAMEVPNDNEWLMQSVANLGYTQTQARGHFGGQWSDWIPQDITRAVNAATAMYLAEKRAIESKGSKTEKDNALELLKMDIYLGITKRGNYRVDRALAQYVRDQALDDMFPDFTYRDSFSQRMMEKYQVDEAFAHIFEFLGIQLSPEELNFVLANNLLTLSNNEQDVPNLWKSMLKIISNPNVNYKLTDSDKHTRALSLLMRDEHDANDTNILQGLLSNVRSMIRSLVGFRQDFYNRNQAYPTLEDERDFLSQLHTQTLPGFLEGGVFKAPRHTRPGEDKKQIPDKYKYIKWSMIEELIRGNIDAVLGQETGDDLPPEP